MEMKGKDLEARLVVAQDWEESERGWGVRPDGCSLHLTEADCRQYISKYWDGMPRFAPDEYERPAGQPYHVAVPMDLYEEVVKGGGNKRLCQYDMYRLRRERA